MSLKVISLVASNYKRLKAVEIHPGDAHVVTISGRNAQGKTSVLDAIWAALAGGEASRAVKQPIRDGEDHATVTLDLGKYVVTREWSTNGIGTLKVTSPEGAKYASPQALLDEVIGARAFDPLAFTRLKEKEQVTALLQTVDLPIDPDELDAQRRGVFDERTDWNRTVKAYQAQLAAFPTLDGVPDEPISVAGIVQEADIARTRNAVILAAREAVRAAEARVTLIAEQIRRLQIDLETAKAYVAVEMDAAAKAGDLVDVDQITAPLADAEAVNVQVGQKRERAKVKAALEAAQQQADLLTARIEQIDASKAEALAAVKFPVEGLSFDEAGVTYNGVPFAQASAAEQLRVSVALAMAANPTLRVLRILDGSLLDEDSLRLLADLAAENDYQVWIETVGDSGTGIIIEDGLVKA